MNQQQQQQQQKQQQKKNKLWDSINKVVYSTFIQLFRPIVVCITIIFFDTYIRVTISNISLLLDIVVIGIRYSPDRNGFLRLFTRGSQKEKREFELRDLQAQAKVFGSFRQLHS
eukprot:GILJ01013599.1.p1 GENE.GILJ01013599.1~~GILJ01013599.1.p1  ORF type:complete len:114 (-),score=12.88 GILJ01013599.1:90-431(-)